MKKTSVAKSSSAPMAHGVGRRKSSVARVWLRKGSGKVLVNKKDFKEYFDTDIKKMEAITAINLCGKSTQGLDFEVNVCGGGKSSQAGAVRLGISRALLKFNEELKSVLREHGLLTVDSRVKERKKFGRKGARRGFQFVKR